ncbi:MAG: glucose-6-phosphate isomerase [Elusimicrobia bacterium]|nr:glucose-6-phosphate isomerase [Elusimicrobiota bacterium]
MQTRRDARHPIPDPAADQGLSELGRARFQERLSAKDASLFKSDPAHRKVIRNSLGWLSLPRSMALALGPIRSFAAEASQEGFKSAVVLGMGGSSLSCEVFRRCFACPQGGLELKVLDSTNPGSVRSLESSLDLKRTLFVVSSKSGATVEPNSMMEYFHARASKACGAKAGRHFVSITDPGTSLEKLSLRLRFRKVFTNPPDIGGRYSVLSNFGLVPAALMGVDVAKLLARAAVEADDPGTGLRLGAALGVLAGRGRDKMTLSLSPGIAALGLWIEQLVAESTGKEGRGIVPVREPISADGGGDRVYVRIALAGEVDKAAEKDLQRLEKSHPVIRFTLPDVYGLGSQFYLWEIATAAAGFLLGVNPFDQPDVASAKDQTLALLSGLEKGKLPKETASFRAGGLAAHADDGLVSSLGATKGSSMPLAQVLRSHWARMRAGDYGAILAFIEETPEKVRLLESVARRLRSGGAPVMLQYGPRYLHSTGQLYKGGAPSGLYILVTEPVARDLPVPGEKYSFAVLHRAQARGDFAAMKAAGRRVLRLDLNAPAVEGLRSLAKAAPGVD